MGSVKGKLFEFFVCKLLLTCGFRQAVEDGLLVFKGKPGTMIQGLGQAHNADVLLEPPFQTPFYFSTRLLVECKCYSDKVGLPIIRNALGLRTDINNFDIVTEDILKNRRSSYTTKCTCYPMKRYSYQVAVASFDGFKSTAISFAQAHRIPLISFSESLLFARIRDIILDVDQRAIEDEEYAKCVLDYLKEYQYEREIYDNTNRFDNAFSGFINEIREFQQRIAIGLLEDGTIIFMIKSETGRLSCNRNYKYNDGCEIYWSDETTAWELCDGGQTYSFELPKEIYMEWINSAYEQRQAALHIKQEYFSKIVLFERDLGERGSIRTINLSERFVESARRSLI